MTGRNTNKHASVKAALVSALALVLATTFTTSSASADEGGLLFGAGLGAGSADFGGFPEAENGWGLSAESNFLFLDDELGFMGSLVVHYFRTADGQDAERVVTIGNFYGLGGGAVLGGDGFFVFGRLAGGFATRSVDDVPDGELSTRVTDRGGAALLGLGILGGEPGSALFGLDISHVRQFGGSGMSYTMGTLSLHIGLNELF